MFALFGLTFGLVEIFLFSSIFLCLIIGVSFDRRGSEDPKWWIFGLGLAGIAVWYWPSWTFFGSALVPAVVEGGKTVVEAQTRVVLWNAISSASFWEPVGAYFVAGLIYSIVEFVIYIRRSARNHKESWEKAVNIGVSVERYVNDSNYKNQIVHLVYNGTKKPEPKINKVQLTEHISAWTFLWPCYALSLILGDLLTEIFNVVADFFVHLSGRFVKMTFKDVF